jgi:uncharacterized protein YkwD
MGTSKLHSVRVLLWVLCWYGILFSISSAIAATPRGCLSLEEQSLVEQSNQYRQNNGLAAVPLSQALTQVAQ